VDADGLAVELRHCDSRELAARAALPAHALERLRAAAHLDAVLAGEAPNDGRPLECARFAVGHHEVNVEGEAALGRFERRFPATALADDVAVLVGQLRAANCLAGELFRYSLVEGAVDREVRRGLRLRGLGHGLPLLARETWNRRRNETGACRHPLLLMPHAEARRLLAHARATPEVETGSVLLGRPFCIDDEAASGAARLGMRVTRAVALGHGTVGDRGELRVTPAALALAAPDPGRGECRLGLAHSHPFGDAPGDEAEGVVDVHFLSREDLAMATAFFWLPFQVQLVVDPRERDPLRAIAAFAWVEGRLARVCFELVE
jgi:hypothetical protein